jgi:hypothetical protein
MEILFWLAAGAVALGRMASGSGNNSAGRISQNRGRQDAYNQWVQRENNYAETMKMMQRQAEDEARRRAIQNQFNKY